MDPSPRRTRRLRAGALALAATLSPGAATAEPIRVGDAFPPARRPGPLDAGGVVWFDRPVEDRLAALGFTEPLIRFVRPRFRDEASECEPGDPGCRRVRRLGAPQGGRDAPEAVAPPTPTEFSPSWRDRSRASASPRRRGRAAPGR